MGRKRKCRHICSEPNITVFKPAGIPIAQITGVTLPLDALEAMRLVDIEGLSQAEASKQMHISTPTLCRILAQGRKQITKALINGMAIRIVETENCLIQQKIQNKFPKTNRRKNIMHKQTKFFRLFL